MKFVRVTFSTNPTILATIRHMFITKNRKLKLKVIRRKSKQNPHCSDTEIDNRKKKSKFKGYFLPFDNRKKIYGISN